MNKSITGLLIVTMILLASAPVFAQTLTRTLPSTISPGQTFQVTYSVTDAPSSKYFVAWDDTVTGCTPADFKSFIANNAGGPQSQTVTFTAPTSGSCTFSGMYQFTGQSASATLAAATVSVSSGNVTGCTVGTTRACTTNSTAGTQTCNSGNGVGVWSGVCVANPSGGNTMLWIIGGVIAGVVLLVLLMKK